MTLPNFFVIGAAKAGTTSLHHYLDQHPEVQMSATKETNFFAGPADGIPYPVGRIERPSDYEALFDPSFPARGEASPSYSSFPRRRGVPERIGAAVSEPRFIYLVRDPVARTLSQHQMLVAAGKEPLSASAAVAALHDADPFSHHLTCQSFYARQLELYLERFPPERILVIDQADLRADRAGTLARVFGFLRVDPSFSSAEFESELFKGGERRRRPRIVARMQPMLRRLPAGIRSSLRGSVESTFYGEVPKSSVEAEDLEFLSELFAEDVERLRQLTGQRFDSWSV